MRESDLQTRFTRWAKHNVLSSAAFELKICKDKSLPFNAVQPHQVVALMQVRKNKLCYKIPDAGVGAKPFDFFCISGEAFVVIMFYKRGEKNVYLIDIIDWVVAEITSDRKSITEEEASKIGRLEVVY